jgi:hypothetical protein
MSARDQVGLGRRTAYALAVFPLDVVQRSTIRALLPVGTTRKPGPSPYQASTGKSDNRVSVKFGQVLRQFAERGWIDRAPELVRILDRDALLACATSGVQGTPKHFLRLDQAAAEVQAQLRSAQSARVAPMVAQRRAELAAIKQLMAGPVGGVNWSGRGSVRFPHKSRAL